LAEDLVSDKPMTLMEITRAIANAKPQLLTAAMEEFIRAKHGDILSQEWAECPCCTKKIRRSAMAPRTIETLLGKATVTRPYYYCVPCKHGFSPADSVLGLSSRRKQADLQKVALEFLADLPFKRASELFFKATGISFSDHQMHAAGAGGGHRRGAYSHPSQRLRSRWKMGTRRIQGGQGLQIVSAR